MTQKILRERDTTMTGISNGIEDIIIHNDSYTEENEKLRASFKSDPKVERAINQVCCANEMNNS